MTCLSPAILTTIATNFAIWWTNLPLSLRVQTMQLASMCHAMPFSVLKNILFVVEQMACGSALSVLVLTTIYSIPVVKICCELTRMHFTSLQHVYYCDGGCHCWQKYIPDLRKNGQFMTACGHYWRNYSKEGNCWSVYWCPWKLHMQPSEVRERQVAYNQRGLCKNLILIEKKELIWNCAQSEKWPVYIICTYPSLCKRRKNFRLSVTIITFAKYPH